MTTAVAPVGVVTDAGRHLLRCFACNYRWQDRLHLPRVNYLLRTYEHAVEAVEAVPAGSTFSIPTLVRAVGVHPVTWRAAGHAVHDMHLHGLLECVQRGDGQSGRQGNCYRWRVVPR